MSREALQPYLFDAPLTVCLDVRHPLAWLAFRPVGELAAELGIAIDWLPFSAPPLARVPEVGADAPRGDRHRRWRALNTARDIRRAAAVQEVALGNPYRSDDSTLALIGLMLARESDADPHGYLERLLTGYWSNSLDIEDPLAVGGILGQAGVDAAGLGSARQRQRLARLRERLVAAGVFTVPTLVAAGEIFVGYAHLPLIRRLLREQACG